MLNVLFVFVNHKLSRVMQKGSPSDQRGVFDKTDFCANGKIGA
jgi:hypothetical protein